MVKLTPAKVRWIIKQKERGELTTGQIARIQRITDVVLLRSGVSVDRVTRYLS